MQTEQMVQKQEIWEKSFTVYEEIVVKEGIWVQYLYFPNLISTIRFYALLVIILKRETFLF